MSTPTVIVKPGEADRIIAGHPWVYGNSIQRITSPPTDGEVVHVKDHRARFLGTGIYNSRSKIVIRMIDHDRAELDRAFFRARITAALAHRRKWLPTATSYRLLNSESDFVSGLIVDRYEDVLVLQTSSLGMDKRKHLIAEVLQELVKPVAIFERNDMSSRKFEGLAEINDVLVGEGPESVMVSLNDLKFEADLAGGHKTGLYLDQQVNYAAVARFAQGAEVLDCFSFLGGFALHAACAGAKHVHGLDQSADAVAAATRNAKTNGLSGNTSFEAINVFDWLKANTTHAPGDRVKPRYDLIILDPPSFTRNRASVQDALRGYKEIHLRALKLLKAGGTLATFCCSHHVDTHLFEEVVLAAAFDAHRILRRVAQYTQSPDHPVLPAVAETEYLKGFAYEVVR